MAPKPTRRRREKTQQYRRQMVNSSRFGSTTTLRKSHPSVRIRSVHPVAATSLPLLLLSRGQTDRRRNENVIAALCKYGGASVLWPGRRRHHPPVLRRRGWRISSVAANHCVQAQRLLGPVNLTLRHDAFFRCEIR